MIYVNDTGNVSLFAFHDYLPKTDATIYSYLMLIIQLIQ